MKTNEGTTDRIVRTLLGIALLVSAYLWLGMMDGAIAGIIAGVIGAILLLTGIVGFCPCYTLCGMNTCKLDHSKGA